MVLLNYSTRSKKCRFLSEELGALISIKYKLIKTSLIHLKKFRLLLLIFSILVKDQIVN